MEILASASGRNGKIEVFEDIVKISRSAVSKAAYGVGNKEFAIEEISVVQLKTASMLAHGFIRVQTSGTGDLRHTKYKDCLKDENTIAFSTGSSEFEKVKTIIMERKSKLKNNNIVVQNKISSADELLKWSELKDKGIISEAEFEKKKNDLLNL